MPVITRTVQFTSDNGETTVENSFSGTNGYMVDVIDLGARDGEKKNFGDSKIDASGYQNDFKSEGCTGDRMA